MDTTKTQWKEYIKTLKKYIQALELWLKKHKDETITADDIGSNPPPPPPPPPGH